MLPLFVRPATSAAAGARTFPGLFTQPRLVYPLILQTKIASIIQVGPREGSSALHRQTKVFYLLFVWVCSNILARPPPSVISKPIKHFHHNRKLRKERRNVGASELRLANIETDVENVK